MKMQGKVAIVTGASAGIGKAYALALAAAGFRVIAAARRLGSAEANTSENMNTLSALVAQSRGVAGEIHAHVCDMENEEEIVRLVEQAAINFGRIDVLVNNAAYLWQIDSFEVTGEEWNRMMSVNVRGPYIAIREVARHMKQQQSGNIINITAGAGNFDERANYPTMLPYAVSKAGLNRLSYFMAAELKSFGIAVNCLSPGVVASEAALKTNPDVEKAGTHKPCTPEVLGPALVYLANQSANTITGQILHTDEFEKSWP